MVQISTLFIDIFFSITMNKFNYLVTSRPTLRRLPLYLRYLNDIAVKGEEYISSTCIAKEFNFDPTQVRKDLAATGEVGVARKGFKIDTLTKAIITFLGWDNVNDAFLVGVGNMGKALLGYSGFEKYGLNIVAAFDKDPEIVGKIINDTKIITLDKLPDLAKRMQVRVGIITVPADFAQGVADLMIENGIYAIWNFAPVPIKGPEDIIIENVRLSTSLAVLTSKLEEKYKAK